MQYYFESGGPVQRIGDEIQMTAILKYLVRHNGHQVWYRDGNAWVSAMSLFPDNLVIRGGDNHHGLPVLDPGHLWFWAAFLKSKGIYTELQHRYENRPDIDCVFFPCLEPASDATVHISIPQVLSGIVDRSLAARPVVARQQRYRAYNGTVTLLAFPNLQGKIF
jgi:hypothetical protein